MPSSRETTVALLSSIQATRRSRLMASRIASQLRLTASAPVTGGGGPCGPAGPGGPRVRGAASVSACGGGVPARRRRTGYGVVVRRRGAGGPGAGAARALACRAPAARRARLSAAGAVGPPSAARAAGIVSGAGTLPHPASRPGSARHRRSGATGPTDADRGAWGGAAGSAAPGWPGHRRVPAVPAGPGSPSRRYSRTAAGPARTSARAAAAARSRRASGPGRCS